MEKSNVLTTMSIHTSRKHHISHGEVPPLNPNPFVTRDSFIKADVQQIQLMYFPTILPTSNLHTFIHSVE